MQDRTGICRLLKHREKCVKRDKILCRRTKKTIYKVTVLANLLHCSDTWSIGPPDIKSSRQHKWLSYGIFVEISISCGYLDESWGQSPPLTKIAEEVPSPLHTRADYVGWEGFVRWNVIDCLSRSCLGSLGANSLQFAPQNLG